MICRLGGSSYFVAACLPFHSRAPRTQATVVIDAQVDLDRMSYTVRTSAVGRTGTRRGGRRRVCWGWSGSRTASQGRVKATMQQGEGHESEIRN